MDETSRLRRPSEPARIIGVRPTTPMPVILRTSRGSSWRLMVQALSGTHVHAADALARTSEPSFSATRGAGHALRRGAAYRDSSETGDGVWFSMQMWYLRSTPLPGTGVGRDVAVICTFRAPALLTDPDASAV